MTDNTPTTVLVFHTSTPFLDYSFKITVDRIDITDTTQETLSIVRKTHIREEFQRMCGKKIQSCFTVTDMSEFNLFLL